MAKYIDAEKLKDEIGSRMEDCKLPDGTFPTTTNIVRYEELSCLRNFITSLQQEQPEVDIEKEIHEKALQLHTAPTYDELEKFAHHFYELGLKARKEDEK